MSRVKCKACRKRFKPSAKLLYIVKERKAPLRALTEVAKTFECIDCPRCGCQKILGIREGSTEESDEEEVEECKDYHNSDHLRDADCAEGNQRNQQKGKEIKTPAVGGNRTAGSGRQRRTT